MFNYQGLKQYIKLCIKFIVINSLAEWIIFFILIMLSSIISKDSFLAQCLTFNILYMLMSIPISLSYSCHELIVIKLHNQSHSEYMSYGYNDVWDTLIALWLAIITVIIVFIVFSSSEIITLYLPNNEPPEYIYDQVYDDLQNVSIPWMCLFIVLYGLIKINYAVFECIHLCLSFKGYSLFNSGIFLIIGTPLTFWLITKDSLYQLPHSLSSLNGIWFSLCCCCFIILPFAIYKRCTINWRYESKEYIKRKIKEKKKYQYDIQLQRKVISVDDKHKKHKRGCCYCFTKCCYYCTICICCNCCFGHLKPKYKKPPKVHDYESNSARNGYQRVHDGNIIDLYQNGHHGRDGDRDNGDKSDGDYLPQMYHTQNSNSSSETNNTMNDTLSTTMTMDTDYMNMAGGNTLVSGSRMINKKTKKLKNKTNKKKIKPKTSHKKRRSTARSLKQVRSWSSLDRNPYYVSSEDNRSNSSLNTIDNDDTLLLKSDSDASDNEQYEDGSDNSNHQNPNRINENEEFDQLAFEQYGADDTLDDGSETVTSSDINQSMDDHHYGHHKKKKYTSRDNEIKKDSMGTTTTNRFTFTAGTTGDDEQMDDDLDEDTMDIINMLKKNKKKKKNKDKYELLSDDTQDNDDDDEKIHEEHDYNNEPTSYTGQSYAGVAMSKDDIIHSIFMGGKRMNESYDVDERMSKHIHRNDSIDESTYSETDGTVGNARDDLRFTSNKQERMHRMQTHSDDDDATITTMDSMEDQQLLNELQSDSSSIQQEIGD